MHRSNIKRFVQGKENQIVLFGKNKSSKKIRIQMFEQLEQARIRKQERKAEKAKRKENSDENNQNN